jgi:hypothetical protein
MAVCFQCMLWCHKLTDWLLAAEQEPSHFVVPRGDSLHLIWHVSIKLSNLELEAAVRETIAPGLDPEGVLQFPVQVWY